MKSLCHGAGGKDNVAFNNHRGAKGVVGAVTGKTLDDSIEGQLRVR
jgi:hypothetical protein